jgi:hypothetical protein
MYLLFLILSAALTGAMAVRYNHKFAAFSCGFCVAMAFATIVFTVLAT